MMIRTLRRSGALVCAILLVFAVWVPAFAASEEENTSSLPFVEGMSGYFVYEMRGSEIPFADAVASLQEWADAKYGDGTTVRLLDETGNEVHTGNVCTGQQVSVGSADNAVLYQVLVRGDAAGTGTPSMSQLVLVAQALAHPENMSELRRAACDLDGNGTVGMADVVLAARYMRGPDEAGPVLPEGPVRIKDPGALAAVESYNLGYNNYNRWASPVSSYLYENDEGNLVRVEWMPGAGQSEKGYTLVEEYNEEFMPVSQKTIPDELPYFGGFFAGEDYLYLFFGQPNTEEDDSKEVIRIVQYDKNWKRIASDGLKGANTVYPFEAGSLRCAEYGGYLYVRTCHEMYTSQDGLNHQANVMICAKQDNLKITDSFTDVMNDMFGYVSHSFNQFVLVDQQGRIVTVDHGDAYPRGIVLMRYLMQAGQDKFISPGYNEKVESALIAGFPGAIGDNDTGGSVGGLEETADTYICVFNHDRQGGGGNREVYAAVLDHKNGEGEVVRLSDENAATQTPQSGSLGLSGGYVMWMQKDGAGYTLKYTKYNDKGEFSAVRDSDVGVLSDCKPVSWNGKLIWYTTDGSAPVFYTLDDTGVHAIPVE